MYASFTTFLLGQLIMSNQLQFKWDGLFWVAKQHLPSWTGFNPEVGYNEEEEHGLVTIVYAPEGRKEQPLSSEEIERAMWVVTNQKALHDSVMDTLFDAYPKIREEAREYIDEEDYDEIMPEISSQLELKQLLNLDSINVHQITKNAMPFIGVTFQCNWDDEHDLGILLHGTNVLEIGGADVACLLWLAEEYSAKL